MATGLYSSAVWFTLWGLRPQDDPTRLSDVAIFLGFQMIQALRQLPIPRDTIRAAVQLLFGFTITSIGILTTVALLRAHSNSSRQTWKSLKCMKPLILRCRTAHTRMFPQKHSFSYDYLQVSIPVGFAGNHGWVSVGPCLRKGWLHINPADYLERNDGKTSLKEKLEAYLDNQVRPSTLHSCAYIAHVGTGST